MAAGDDRCGPAGTIRGTARERELLPCAGRIAGAGARLSGGRRSVPWPQRGHPQRRIVAAARFAGDSSIVGRQIRLDDNLYTVTGVPASFETVLAPSAEILSQSQYDTSLPTDG